LEHFLARSSGIQLFYKLSSLQAYANGIELEFLLAHIAIK